MTHDLQHFLSLAAELQKAGDYSGATNALERASSIFPNHRPWFELAGAFLKVGMLDKASWCYARGLDDDSTTNELDRKMVGAAPHFPQRRRIGRIVERNLSRIRNYASKLSTTEAHQLKYFVYWNSGFENAPPIAQKCHAEMKRLLGDQLVTLTEKTLPYYVDLPQAVTDKVPANTPHFSDVLRVALLARYGGVWADATCLPGDDFKRFSIEAAAEGFFAYQRGDEGGISSWFMCSGRDNYIPRMIYATLCLYWAGHNKLTHYFMVHHIFEVLYHLDEKFARTWDSRIKKSATAPHRIQKSMFSTYDEKIFVRHFAGAAVHKLTHKYRGRPVTPDTTVAHLIRGDYPHGQNDDADAQVGPRKRRLRGWLESLGGS